MRRAIWLLPVMAVPALGLLAFGLTRSPQNLPSALIGTDAPAFRLALMAEGPTAPDSLDFSEYRGKVVVLNFWASWCLPCRDEHPVLIELTETYDPEDVRLLGVVYQDTPDNGVRYMRQFGGDWPSVMDPGSRTAIEYGVYGVPETFFIGADGRIAHKHIGAVTRSLVREKVDSLLAARPDLGPIPAEPLETTPSRGEEPASEGTPPPESGDDGAGGSRGAGDGSAPGR